MEKAPLSTQFANDAAQVAKKIPIGYCSTLLCVLCESLPSFAVSLAEKISFHLLQRTGNTDEPERRYETAWALSTFSRSSSSSFSSRGVWGNASSSTSGIVFT